MKSILDPAFKYRNSSETDVAATFKRVRREQKRAADAKAKEADEAKARAFKVAPNDPPAGDHVVPIRKART